MKQSKLSILFPRQDEVTYREIPEESWHDLGLDALTEKVAATPQEVPLISRVMMSLTADPRVAAFRSDVFEDILRHPEIRNRLMKLLDKVKLFYDYGVVSRHAGDEAGVWDLMHRLEEYHDYIVTVEAIRSCLENRELVSDGLRNLRETICGIYESSGFAATKNGAPAGTPSSAPAGNPNPAAGDVGAPGFAVTDPLTTNPVSSRSMQNVICENRRRTAFCRCICACWNFMKEARSRSVAFVPPT